eukprot:SAG31_NODE_5963_length_2236_cov_1.144127_1_plen_360_part_00
MPGEWGDGDKHAGWKYPHGRHWTQARRLNHKVMALSPTLMNLTSVELLRIRATDAPELTAHPERNQSRAERALALAGIAETVGCTGQSAGSVSPKSDTATVFGCWTGYDYVRCDHMRVASTVAENPCTLDGSECAVPINAGSSFCIDDYPASQCRALCEAAGGAGGASGIAGTSSLDASCVAYATAAVVHRTPAGATQSSDKTERCCLYTSTFATNATTGQLLPGNSTLYVQVGTQDGTNNKPHWQCSTRLPTTPAALFKRLSVGGEFVVGEFEHTDGRKAVMVQNFDHTLSAMPTLVFPDATVNATADPTKPVLHEVVQRNSVEGEEVAVEDELLTVPGLQISLDASEARLFLLRAPP